MFGVSLALIVLLASTVRSAEPAKADPVAGGSMMDDCRKMQEHKQKAMAAMKAEDAELAKQVAAMNSAPENKKVALMAALLTRMVEQRAAMHQQAEKMHEEMTQHMMKHAGMGGDSMAQCPMMTRMGGDKPHADMRQQPAAK